MSDKQGAFFRAVNPCAARLHSRLRHPRPLDFPRSLVIETTSRCNLQCPMCPRSRRDGPGQDMSWDLFQSLIDQIAEADARDLVDLVALHGFGEPLLHPRLLEFIEYAGQRLPNVVRRGALRDAMKGLNLSTNAVLLDEQMALGLLESRLTWLALSIDGTTRETYEAMRVGACYEEVMGNVERLLQLNRQRPRALPTLAVQIIASRSTEPQFAEAVRRWRELAGGAENVRVELKPFTDWAGQVDAKPFRDQDSRRDFLYLYCGHPSDTQVIQADGRMALCCYDVLGEEGLGNANVTPLRELWQEQMLREIRALLRQGKAASLPLCRNCAMGRKYPLDLLRR